MALSGIEKATILISILGGDASSKMLKFLPAEVADLLASGINRLPKPSPEAISAVLSECREYLALPGMPERRPALEEGVPSPRRPEQARSQKPGEIISRVPGRILIPLLMRERPQTIAFVLTHLPEGKAAEVLSYLPEQRREVEYLLNTIKFTPLTEKIRDDVLQYVASRLS